MSTTYLMMSGMRVAAPVEQEMLDFLVANGYAVHYKALTFDGEEIHYYKPKDSE